MKFVVLFEDNPDVKSDIRQKHMPEHLEFLKTHSKNVSAAGPLSNLDKTGAGGIWIVEASDESEIRQLVEKDPFWPTALDQSAG